MTEVIPGVLAKTLKELKEQLDILKFAKKIHIDVMDGKFVPNKTIQALSLKKYLPCADLQIHLMAHKPHKYVNTYKRLGAKEFIFHAEATSNAPEILENIRMHDMKAGIAFNPTTEIEHHKDALIHADLALVMTVNPGFSGQTFMRRPLLKIEKIKKINPLVKIGVDGGINLGTCKLAGAQGANFAIATSSIQKAQNPKEAHIALERAMKLSTNI